MQTVTSFNPRQLHRYRFEGEPSVTFSLKELKVSSSACTSNMMDTDSH